MIKQLRHKSKVRRNLRAINRYYGIKVSKHPKQVKRPKEA